MAPRASSLAKLVLCAAGLSIVAAAMAASATTLGGVRAAGLGAGDAAVTACDPDGLTVTYATQGGIVTTATVGGIADPACEGASLTLTLQDTSGTAVATGGPTVVPTDGDTSDDTVALAVSPQPPADAVARVAIQIAGP